MSLHGNSADGGTQAASEFRGRNARLRLAFAFVVVLVVVLWGLAFELFPSILQDESTTAVAVQRRQSSEFDLGNAIVNRQEIFAGGPPKDGIPALTKPAMIQATKAKYLQPQDRVIGVVVGKEARAYPLAILNYHEIVNDTLGETPVAVTYCPLCDSVAVFDRRTPLGVREFGVSGLLYNSNVLMYDRGGKPESLWSQVKTQGISGPAVKKSLSALPVELTTWKDWLARYPQSRVMSPNTGHQRDYSRNPYAAYFQNQTLMFPAKPSSDRFPAKSRVLGVWTENATRAYPESSFSAENRSIDDELDGKELTIEYNPEAQSLRVAKADEGLQWMYSFWFTWYALHPETTVHDTKP